MTTTTMTMNTITIISLITTRRKRGWNRGKREKKKRGREEERKRGREGERMRGREDERKGERRENRGERKKKHLTNTQTHMKVKSIMSIISKQICNKKRETHTYIYKYSYIHTFIYIYMHTFIHIYVYTYLQTYIQNSNNNN